LIYMRKHFFVKQSLGKELNAGPKAKVDTYRTLERLGYKPIVYISKSKYRLFRYAEGLGIVIKLVKLKNSLVFMENPIKNWRFLTVANKIMKLRNNHLVLLIHDIESERYSFPRHIEYSFINSFNSIIVHNNAMRTFLSAQVDKKIKINTLGIFDYLLDAGFKTRRLKTRPASFIKERWEIIFCGNLGREKSSFIYALDSINPENWQLDLYGSGIENMTDIPFIKYRGSFSPDNPVVDENSDFGLIWDGASIDTCEGITGNYMKINNPHKLSLYIALNLPIIVWNGAAVSKFVEDNGLGFSINSLSDISGKLSALTYADYDFFQKNLANFNAKVTSGEYLIASIMQIDDDYIKHKLQH
jgi:hypothetical protein